MNKQLDIRIVNLYRIMMDVMELVCPSMNNDPGAAALQARSLPPRAAAARRLAAQIFTNKNKIYPMMFGL